MRTKRERRAERFFLETIGPQGQENTSLPVKDRGKRKTENTKADQNGEAKASRFAL
jgi:hypothetical protein